METTDNTTYVYVADCNRFASDLSEILFIDGLSVEDAVNQIDYTMYLQNMADICVIAGNRDNSFR